MAEPANRPGGMRGPAGGTLDGVIAAIGELKAIIGAGANSAETLLLLQSISTSLGQIDQCSDKSVIQLLCETLTQLNGGSAAQSTPPGSCPGYDVTRVVAFGSSWYKNTYPSGPGIDVNLELTVTGAGNGLSVIEFRPAASPGYNTRFFQLHTSKPATNVCIVGSGMPTGIVRVSWARDGASGMTPLVAVTGEGYSRASFSLDAGDFLWIDAHNPSNEDIPLPYGASIWIIQGAFG